MKKILIYLEANKLAPVGGPNGYNYNLKKGLESIDTNMVIDYLPSNNAHERISIKVNSSFRDRIKRIGGCLKSKFGLFHKSVVSFENYDVVHFQSTYSMYKVRDTLKEYKGIVLLQSHTPTKPSEEAYDIVSEHGALNIKCVKKILECADEYAFNRADYILFPCEYAEEPYQNHWREYCKIKEKNNKKYKYLLTGTERKIAKVEKSIIRKSNGIPDDAFVISYVGRHNEIKGYDLLKKLGNDLIDADKNIYFLVAGKEEPLHGLNNDRWVEIGWTRDPHSIISASDIFILPNRETYFDLVLLEVLSLGQIVLISNTGGNKFFKEISGKGIFIYDTLDEAIEIVKYIQQLDIEQITIMKENNRRVYTQYFSNDVFARNYVSLLEDILS